MDITIDHIVTVYGGILIAAVGFVVRAIRHTVSKDELKDELDVLHRRLDDRPDRIETDAKLASLEKRIDELRDLVMRHDDAQRASFRELREMLQRLQDREAR